MKMRKEFLYKEPLYKESKNVIYKEPEFISSKQMVFTSREELKKFFNAIEKEVVIEYCYSATVNNKNSSSEYNLVNSYKRFRKYCRIMPGGLQNISIRWENIHGKHRKNIKRLIKKLKRRCIEQIRVWNKYADKDGVILTFVNETVATSLKKYMAIMGESENFEILEIIPWYRTYIESYYDKVLYAVFFKNKEE